MSRIFASVWSIAVVWIYNTQWRRKNKNIYLIFFTLFCRVTHQAMYTTPIYKSTRYTKHTYIALRPLNQDENKLMIYVLLNIHEGNPWLMWEKKLRKQKCCWCENLDRKCLEYRRNVGGWLKGENDQKKMSFAFNTFLWGDFKCYIRVRRRW